MSGHKRFFYFFVSEYFKMFTATRLSCKIARIHVLKHSVMNAVSFKLKRIDFQILTTAIPVPVKAW